MRPRTCTRHSGPKNSTRGDAERVARQMMETYEADHFRRVIEVGERIG